METTFGILIYPRKNRVNKKGETPLIVENPMK